MKSKLLLIIVLMLNLACTDAEPVNNFGSNPGNVNMYKYVPEDMPANAPLVIALHGCLQDAETYYKTGWKTLADKWKFYLIFPEQKRSNNLYKCWNWFQTENTKRDHGEAKSIVQMVEKMTADYSINDSRIYVEGLSAGAYMVSALLASYPDVFAGGATSAGGPALCAQTEKHFWDIFSWWYLKQSFSDAKTCMNGIDKSPEEWGELVRNEVHDDFDGSWPIISIWQGAADESVNKINQQELIDQWTNLHGIDQLADKENKSGDNANVIHEEYHNDDGKPLVESYLIPDMSHGIAITTDANDSCGETDKYILDAAICAVQKIALFWKLNPAQQ